MAEPHPKSIDPREYNLVPDHAPENRMTKTGNMGCKLDQVVAEDPEKFGQPTIDRVRELIEYQAKYPDRKTPYRLLQEPDDFSLYYRLHPEWKGKSAGEVKKDTLSGGNAFYISFTRCLRAKGISLVDREIIISQVLGYKVKDWSKFTAIEDWMDEIGRHPEWQGMSVSEISKNHKLGVDAFYKAFTRWTHNVESDSERRKQMMRKVFTEKKRKTRWNYVDTIDKWIDEYSKHPEWNGMSPKVMAEDKEFGAAEFYQAFRKWIRRAIFDKRQRDELSRKFLAYANDSGWSFSYNAKIEDWLDEFQKHPEWQGRTPREMHDDTQSGASAFYSYFNNWLKKATITSKEREKYVRMIFPNIKRIRMIKEQKKDLISSEEANRWIDSLFGEGEKK